MPTVEAEVFVHAPLDRVYALARDIERFPDFMDDVQEVKILERGPTRQVSRWVAVVKEFGRTITWTEEDFWDDEQHVCTFRQMEGDFTSYGGEWDFKAEGEGTHVRLEVTYEYRVPLIGPLIQRLLQKKMHQNCMSMLEAIKRACEAES
jgi:uncharacterized membrane protein